MKLYNNFNLEIEQEPIVQLHKTDYNDYGDLSHFVDEYYKAQALIRECNNFYKSFLLSKLLTYTKLTNTSYKENEYKFFNIEITDKSPYNLCTCDTYNLFNEFKCNNIDDIYKGYYNYKSILGYDRLAYSRAVFKFKEICDNAKDKLFTIKIRCERVNYFPDSTEEPAYFFTFNDYILNDFPSFHTISSYGSITYDNEYDKKELETRLKKLYNKTGEISLYNYMKHIDTVYHNEFKYYYKEELKKVFKEINVPIVHIKIKNDLKECAYSSYKSYIKHVKRKDVDENIKNLSEKYKNEGTYTSLYINEILSNDEIDKMFDSFDNMYNMKNLIINYLNDNYYDKITELVTRNISDAIYAYRTIIRTCSEYNDNQKLYIIGKHNESHYFCDQKDVDKINIELKGRKLECIYTQKEKHLKYRWPSDAPMVVTELTRVVVFNVDDNTVDSFGESSNTYEVSRDKYY